MEYVDLVIKISKEIYQDAITTGYSHLYDDEVANAISNGVPLQIILDKLESEDN